MIDDIFNDLAGQINNVVAEVTALAEKAAVPHAMLEQIVAGLNKRANMIFSV